MKFVILALMCAFALVNLAHSEFFTRHEQKSVPIIGVTSASPPTIRPQTTRKMTFDEQVEVAIDILYELESSSGADVNFGDTAKYPGQPGQWAHGILQIRWKCLKDYNDDHKTVYTLEEVHRDAELSKTICRYYFKRYATEKRLGRRPTVVDMGRIWKGGPNGWRLQSTEGRGNDVRRELAERGIPGDG